MEPVAKETKTSTQTQETSKGLPMQFSNAAKNLAVLYDQGVNGGDLEEWLSAFMQFDNQVKAYTSEAAEDYETLSSEEKGLRRQLYVDTGDVRHDALFAVDGMRVAFMGIE